jgi:hypothetical protein
MKISVRQLKGLIRETIYEAAGPAGLPQALRGPQHGGIEDKDPKDPTAASSSVDFIKKYAGKLFANKQLMAILPMIFPYSRFEKLNSISRMSPKEQRVFALDTLAVYALIDALRSELGSLSPSNIRPQSAIIDSVPRRQPEEFIDSIVQSAIDFRAIPPSVSGVIISQYDVNQLYDAATNLVQHISGEEVILLLRNVRP